MKAGFCNRSLFLLMTLILMLASSIKPIWSENIHVMEPDSIVQSRAVKDCQKSKSPEVPEIQFSPLREGVTESGRGDEAEKTTEAHMCGIPCLPRNTEPVRNDAMTTFFRELNGKSFASGGDNQDELKLLEEEWVQSDRPMKRPEDVENQMVIMDFDYYYKSYKDGRNVYNALPLLIRIDTGRNTEARISSDFLAWQDPVIGFNDITVGFKWQFAEKNPSMALMAACELPTAGAGIGDPGAEPGAMAIIDLKLGKRWDWLINVGAVNNVDGSSFERYWQWNYNTEFDYSLNDKSTLSLALITTCPNAYPDGTNLSRLDLGYYYNPRPDTQFYVHVARGLSPVDRDWVVIAGVSRGFHNIFGSRKKDEKKE
ncbi:MAG: hypothetical protein AB2L14_03115 [Candidatus Xenobiia bacterium LiM19]